MDAMDPPASNEQEDENMLVPQPDLVEGPQRAEAPEATDITEENQPAEGPRTTKFSWRIDNFSRIDSKKIFSDTFELGEYKWRILIFPKGNNTPYLSMYLDVANSSYLPHGWSRQALFSLTVVNQVNVKYSLRKVYNEVARNGITLYISGIEYNLRLNQDYECHRTFDESQHQFNSREKDWGFTSFMPLAALYDPSRGYVFNDTCVIEAEIAEGMHAWLYDSKKETGFVGLKNQGATCYMNSLLQTLYHIPFFRKVVYHMPTSVNDVPSTSIPLALQSLFYKLQYSDNSVATKELTQSFGWDTDDAFLQHDVQELNRVLCENLEEKMKRTVVEGAIQQLFEGHHMNYIECINVEHKSSRKESFYDLQLDVKDCHDVYASFDKYVEVEHLVGNNKYHAEKYGLQDAKKGVLFIDFPPVLQLHLKRFEYDFAHDIMVKINDRYEFPLQLDLDRDNGKYLSPEADRRVRNLYTLHSVLVHSGGVHDGHYHAFIRTLSNQWYKFDDERVTKEDMKKALEELYGGEEEINPGINNILFKFTKHSNAYMLVYIRESDTDKIMCQVDEKDIAKHLMERLQREQEEKAEAHLYTVVKVACDEDFARQIGKNIFSDLVDYDKVRSFRVQKLMPFNIFKEEVAKEFGIPVQFQRFWLWSKRLNHTYRPNRPLNQLEEAQTFVSCIFKLSRVVGHLNVRNVELRLYLESELGQGSQPLPLPIKTKDDILLFFKLYDPEKEELRYAGKLFVKSMGKPSDILIQLNEIAGYAPDEEIELYEEIKFEPPLMCEHIDKRFTFKSSELEDGDIVCFQKSLSAEASQQFRCPDVPSFFEYRRNLQVIRFRSLEKPKENELCLPLSKLDTYDEVVEKVAHQLGVDDPSKIRLTSHNTFHQQPNPQSVKYRGVDNLLDMLLHCNQTSDILYYEILDMPLPELQCLRTLQVAFRNATNHEIEIHNIRVPREGNVSDVLDDLRLKAELSHPEAELRLLEVFSHRIYKIFSSSEKIESINDNYWNLRAEEIPEEEKNLGAHDCLIHVYHFMNEEKQNQVKIQNFGEPFLLVIHEDETLDHVKNHVQKKLNVPDEDFSKWKFAYVSQDRAEYLEDSDIPFRRFQRSGIHVDWLPYLGLEHVNNAPKRPLVASQYRQPREKAVRIYN
ncbi:ubiquitin carboxyl-terminal hydrolase 13 [Castilleja foliolosa]|uniref:ubiquitinyl hydrolase 1 n=1 Tax=Castilleja foliolosa TaxID=1961234 RepID=A0ABD3BU43_9LAMI